LPMELRLFKEPYQEPFLENRLRLLFEGRVDTGSGIRTGRDVYLYVWIESRRSLAGFQAVLDEEFVVEYHPPSKLEFSRISQRPVKRSLSRPITGQEQKEFCACLRGLSNPLFPDLIKNIESIAQGAPIAGIDLTEKESETLDKLAGSSSGVPT
jgi:hypothetical protein